MTPTNEQIEKLARHFATQHDGDDERWEDLYLDNKVCVVTSDTLEDFRRAARTEWAESSTCKVSDAGIYWDRIQVAKGMERVTLGVIDCGEFRLAYRE